MKNVNGNVGGDNIEEKILSYLKWFVFALVVLIVLFGSFYSVGAGQRGVITTFGKAEMNSINPGLHLKIPLAQKITRMDVQTQKYEADASAASKDLQIVSTKIAVNYHLAPESVPLLYKEIGLTYREKVIQPAVQEIVKASTAQFTAEELITKRDLVKENIDRLLAERLVKQGIILETTSITNFDFSAQFNAAIEQKVTTEQNALTEKNKLAQIEYQAQQAVAAAEGQRDAAIAAAEAQAKTIQLTAEAEAKKVELINDQLSQSPDYIEYVKATRWNGQLPMYMMGNTVPLMQLPSVTN